jgi:hypothetical protein
MALTFTKLTGNGGSSATSFNTASVTPGALELVVIDVHAYISTGSVAPPQPTVTGNGITYALDLAQDTDNAGTDRGKLFRFRGMSASPSTGAITISFGATTMTRCVWSVADIAGVDTSGTNGSGAFAQVSTGFTTASGATSCPVSFGFAMTSGNGGFYACGHQVQEGKTPKANWSELDDQFPVTLATLETQWTLTTSETGGSSTFSASRAGGIVSEIKAAAAAGATMAPHVISQYAGFF